MTSGTDGVGEHAAGPGEEDIIEDVRIAAIFQHVGEDDDCIVTIMTEGEDHESYTVTIMILK